jgi:mono/diheme cytochrome c family protein
LPINRPPWSLITATDMNRGEHIWSRSIGGAPDEIRNHPALKGLNLDFDNMGQPGVRPGPLLSKTLLFLAEAGNLSGDPGGPMFRAYDKRTGAVIAEIKLPSKASGAPMTYMHQGRQYIVIAVATRDHPAELVALALPKGPVADNQSLDLPQSITTATTNRSAINASAEELRAGREIYARACAACHGAKGEGVSGNTSPLFGLSDLNSIRRIVRIGSVKMPPMQSQLTRQQIEQVSKFVAVEFNRR